MNKAILVAIALLGISLANAAWAGASATIEANIAAAQSSSSGGRLEKVNRYAVKSAVLVRQLLAQNRVKLAAAPQSSAPAAK